MNLRDLDPEQYAATSLQVFDKIHSLSEANLHQYPSSQLFFNIKYSTLLAFVVLSSLADVGLWGREVGGKGTIGRFRIHPTPSF